MALPPGKKWVIAEGESVEVTALGRIHRQLFLRHAKTSADPYWVFQEPNGATIYLEVLESLRRTNMSGLTAPSEDMNR